MTLEFTNVTKTFMMEQGPLCVLRDVSFCMPANRITALIGRSGSGKTTLLRLAAGFEKPDSGKIVFDGSEILSPSYKRFMVFQAFNQLFPWKSIEDNIVYALRHTAQPNRDRAREISGYWLNEAGLYGYRKELPSRLSGGMKQRAAIARAFAIDPSLLLLDEPFSALDFDNKKSLLELLQKLCGKKNLTVVFVTHDRFEADFLSDSVFAVTDGRVALSEPRL